MSLAEQVAALEARAQEIETRCAEITAQAEAALATRDARIAELEAQASRDALAIATLTAEIERLKGQEPVYTIPAAVWTLTANRDYFDKTLQRKWLNPNVTDWLDADGVPQGDKPLATATVKARGELRIPVGNLRDITIRQSTALVKYAAGFKLEVGGQVYDAVAETHIATTTTTPQAASTARRGTMLARFDAPEGDGTLILNVTYLYAGGAGTVASVYRTHPTLPRPQRPAWVQADPTVLLDLDTPRTKTLQPDELTWWSFMRKLDGLDTAFATVFIKLHDDFAPGDGGKLPGLSNTGQAWGDASKTAWGGRAPDGVHWSARTGFGGFTATEVALRTYFYAMSPHNSFGWGDPTGYTLPKGRWMAYVQGVKLNTAGQPDGGLYYWHSEHGDIYARDNIRWRDQDVPEAKIREFWLDVYCGGTDNGGLPSTVSIARCTVTKGLPDLLAVQREVARLNALP